MRKHIVFCALLACLVVVAAPVRSDQEGQHKRPAEPISSGQRVFTCAHSFHFFVALILPDVARGAAIKGHETAGLSAIGGSRVTQHWDVPEDRNKAREALRSGKVDVLTLSPIHLPDEGIEKFARLALEHNPNARITVQEFWLPYDQYDPASPLKNRKVDHNAATGASLRKSHEPYFKGMDDHVRELNRKLGRGENPAVFVVPVGQAVIALREKVIAGEAPGIGKQEELFTDPIGHPTTPIQALATYCHFAVIYRKSPVGLPVPEILKKHGSPKLSEELNRLLQELAWRAVTDHPLSGVKAEAP